MRRLALSLGFVLLACASAHAQDSGAPDAGAAEEARVAFTAAAQAYDAGRYELALTGFQRAYELTGHPDVLYNIGQSADRLRRDAEAVEAFERYLAEGSPDADSRASIEARVASLRAAIAERAAPPEEPDPAPVTRGPEAPAEPPPAEPSVAEQWWFWTILALVVVGAGVGIGVGVALSQPGYSQSDVGDVIFTLGSF